MKKNILTAIAVFILSIILFFVVSTSTTFADNQETSVQIIENSISETYIPSEIIVSQQLNGIVLTAEVIEEKQIKNEVEVKQNTVKKPNKTTSFKEDFIDGEGKTWEEKKAQYPVATQIWLYMKDLGWSDAVCAGIMGNIMAEVGGQTLNIRPYLYGHESNRTYYGICQWYLPNASSKLKGASLEYQCNYLKNTIKKEFNVFGYKYSSSMNYENFLALNDPAKAALAFAKCYERCASFSYNIRQKNAQKAYNYFVG